NPPYLLFYADANHDDVPDGPPAVLLAGFGLEDTHSVANSLRWGPDGWLYGAGGSTTTGNITRPGVDAPNAKPVHFLGQLIWRYHPATKRFEIFAEGGGNTFGLEIKRVAAARLVSRSIRKAAPSRAIMVATHAAFIIPRAPMNKKGSKSMAPSRIHMRLDILSRWAIPMWIASRTHS
ncbi:MAG TPA: hypothetical protein VI282_14390, partial [Verrucomicrobiae bacterium]